MHWLITFATRRFVISLSLIVVILLNGCANFATTTERLPSERSANERYPGFHAVQRRENLSMIAKYYNSDYREIAAANGISSPYIIHPGQVLRIPNVSTIPHYDRDAGVDIKRRKVKYPTSVYGLASKLLFSFFKCF
jgi:uncharacterized protein YceK